MYKGKNLQFIHLIELLKLDKELEITITGHYLTTYLAGLVNNYPDSCLSPKVIITISLPSLLLVYYVFLI